MYLLRLYLVVFFILWSGAARAAEDRKTMTFSQVSGSPMQVKAALLITKIYSRFNIDTEYLLIPGRRSLEMSNAGKTDGELFRIWEVGVTYPNLLRVPTPIMGFRGYAYRLDGPAINSVDELTKDFRIGVQRGLVWSEKLVAGRKAVVRTKSMAELVRKLLKGSIDVALYTGVSLEAEFKKRNSQRQLVKGRPITVLKVYHYLHKKNAAMLDKVDAEIKRLISIGDLKVPASMAESVD